MARKSGLAAFVLVLGVSLIAGYSLEYPRSAWAQSTSSAGSLTDQTAFSNALKSSTTNATAKLQTLASCAANPSKIKALLKKKDKKYVAYNTPCVSAPLVDSSKLSCEYFSRSKEGEFDLTMLQDVKTQNEKSQSYYDCREGKLDAIQAELNCYKQESQQIANYIKSVDSQLAAGLLSAQQKVQLMNSTIEARNEQLKDIGERLNGSPINPMGLRQIEAEGNKIVNSELPGAIRTLEKNQESIVQQKKALKEQAQIREVALSSSCFKSIPGTAEISTGRPYQCYTNCLDSLPSGPGMPAGVSRSKPQLVSCSAMQYYVCKFKYQNKVGSNRQVKQGFEAEDVERKGNQLYTLLNQMLSEAPSESKVPGSADEAAKQANQPLGVLSVSQMESRYKSQIDALRIGFNNNSVSSEIFEDLRSCGNQAKVRVAREREMANTPLGIGAFKIRDLEKDTRAQVEPVLKQATDMYTKGLKGLVDGHFPIDVDKCISQADLGAQLTCVKDIKTNLTGLIKGTKTNAWMKPRAIAGKSTAGVQDIAVDCVGVTGCIAKYETLAKQIETTNKDNAAKKTAYVQSVNSAIDQFVSQLVDKNRNFPSQLSSHLEQIRAELGKFKVQARFRLDDLPREQLKKDQDGLYQKPESILNLIGGQIGLKDINNPDAFDDGGIAEAMDKLEDDNKKIKEVKTKLTSLAESCTEDKLLKSKEKLETALSKASSASCNLSPVFCPNQGSLLDLRNSLGSLQQSMNGLGFSGEISGLSGLDSPTCQDADQFSKWKVAKKNVLDAQLAYDNCVKEYPSLKDAALESQRTLCSTKQTELATANRELSGYPENFTRLGQVGENDSECRSILTELRSSKDSVARSLIKAQEARGIK